MKKLLIGAIAAPALALALLAGAPAANAAVVKVDANVDLTQVTQLQSAPVFQGDLALNVAMGKLQYASQEADATNANLVTSITKSLGVAEQSGGFIGVNGNGSAEAVVQAITAPVMQVAAAANLGGALDHASQLAQATNANGVVSVNVTANVVH